jgi:hypothetical protein
LFDAETATANNDAKGKLDITDRPIQRIEACGS